MADPKAHLGSMPEYQAKWDRLVLSTEPADREKAEQLICKIYQQLHSAEPPQIIWVDSPWHPLVRTAKIYEYDKTRDARFGRVPRKINDGTFHSHQRRMINTTFKRLGLDSRTMITNLDDPDTPSSPWADIPVFSLSLTTTNLSRIMWRSQHAGFYYGNHYQDFAFFDWCRNACGMVVETRAAALAIELAQTVAWWRPHEKLCFISERPTKLTFNNPTGPAITWGVKHFYMIDGVEVPENVITNPASITIVDIVNEQNVEVRRVMINRYGIGDFLKDSKALRRDHDERYGTLWRIPRDGELKRYIRNVWNSLTDMVYLEVVNRTPEPDGSFKHYFLRMPPSISNGRGGSRMLNSAKEAYDWSFGNLPVTSWDMAES